MSRRSGSRRPVEQPVEPPVLRVDGELTVQTAADRKGELLALLDRGEQLTLDLSGVTELDTAGLQLLLMLRREAAQLGRALDVVGAPGAVVDTLAIVHLDPTLQPLAAAVPGDR